MRYGKLHGAMLIIALSVLCAGCGKPRMRDAGAAILSSSPGELAEYYGVTEDDFGIQSVHYGCFTGPEREALVAFNVADPAKHQAIADRSETFVAFCVYDARLQQKKTQPFSLLADSITYNVIRPYGAEKDYLYVNAVDVAAGPEEFVGGVYDAADWKNILPIDDESDPYFMPLIIGDELYKSSVRDNDPEKLPAFRWDRAENALSISYPD